jgi:Cation transport ATPase
MDRPPRDPRESIFSREVLPLLLTIPLVMSPILLGLYFIEYAASGEVRATTLIFLTFVFLELVVALNCRSLRFSVFKAPPHKLLIAAVVWEAALISTLISIPSVREAFRITLPYSSDMLLIAAACLIVFIIIEIIKVLVIPKRISKA